MLLELLQICQVSIQVGGLYTYAAISVNEVPKV